ncbi:three-Cys-motif partner protein TcmP [Neisseria weixii]|uniref:three-Cys-motif partner protein TcmP n=1 Tax=Neisseria weixii TaxID=1853276 RepID=UPI0018F33582
MEKRPCRNPATQRGQIKRLGSLKTLASLPQQDIFKLTLVDGFAGGGLYYHKDTQAEIHGSPLVCLQAVQTSEYLLNQGRTKPLVLDVDYFFVEEDKDTYNHLLQTLKFKGYNPDTNHKIHIQHANFHDRIHSIVDFINKKSPRNGRSIFILDQYGYSDVPTSLIRNILSKLPRAEIILTFSVDSFINFASGSETTGDLLKKIGIYAPEIFNPIKLNELKQSDKNWRLFIQSSLYEKLVNACGAKFFTPFFIRNPGGHGDYWLIHMSQHFRARDVMAGIHWQHQNNFIHYGDAGLNMFNLVGYDPSRDDNFTGQSSFGFEFDDIAKTASIKQLSEQFPRLIYAHEEGLSFETLFSSTCNGSPASSDIYRDALGRLIVEKEITVVGADGTIRKNGQNIKNNDQILPPRQRSLFGL